MANLCCILSATLDLDYHSSFVVSMHMYANASNATTSANTLACDWIEFLLTMKMGGPFNVFAPPIRRGVV